MPPKDSRELIDRFMGGKLEMTLREWRASGLSFAQMRDKLYLQIGVELDRETLRRWCNDLNMPHVPVGLVIDGDMDQDDEGAA